MPKRTPPGPRSKPKLHGSDQEQAWLDMTPVGREFGSPDFERLTELDQVAFAALQSWEKVRHWLATPNPLLDGACPEDAARSRDGLNKVMSVLMMSGERSISDGSSSDPDGLPPQALKSLKGMFGRPSKRASIQDMNDAIARRGAGKK